MAVRRMSTREARAKFGDLLGSVYYTKEPVIIERNGRPFAVVVSPEQYERLEAEQRRIWDTIERIQQRNADKDPDEILRLVTAEVEAVRQEMYEERKKAAESRS